MRGGGGSARQRGGPRVPKEDHVSTLTHEAGRQVALERIRVPDNVRALDDAHVQALAGSIALQGMLVPVVVRSDGDGFELVAGFHRDRGRAVARPGRGAGRRPRRRDRGRRPRGGEHHAQAAQPVRGGQGRPRDARPRADRGRRRPGARLAQDAGHGAREDPRAARARPAADRRRRDRAVGRRPAARDRRRRAGAAGCRDRLPGRRQRLGRRTPRARARLGARRRDARDRRQDLRRLPRQRELARDRRAAARQEDRAAVRRRGAAASPARPLRLRAAADPIHRGRRRPGARRRRADRVRAAGRPIIVDRPLYRELVKGAIKRTHDELQTKADRGGAGEAGRALEQGAGRPAHDRQARARRAAARAHRPGDTAPTSTSASR